jgi:multiple sugar transport system permease protein
MRTILTTVQPKRLQLARRETRAGWLMAAPWLIGFCFFLLTPILVSLWTSFTDYSLLSTPKFSGLKNYVKLFKDPLVAKSLWITLYYTLLSVPLTMVLGFSLALLLNRKIYGQAFFRTVYYLPSILNGVAVGLLWRQVFNPDFGILNYVLNLVFHVGKVEWLNNPDLVIPSLVMVSLWGVGRTMVVNLAGLQNIPTALYESARIDGCPVWRSIWNITIPMMTPILFLNLITGLISAFRTFTNAYVMTNGGPNKASLFYMLYLYQSAFQNFRMGYASALSWLLFLIMVTITFVLFRTSRYWVYSEGGDLL